MKYVLSILVIASFFTACKKAEVKDAQSKLKGSWYWVQSSGGIAGSTYTPSSEGYDQRLEFTNSTVTKLRADTVEFEEKFKLSTGMSDITGEEEVQINPGPANMKSTVLFDGDTIHFIEECFDCFSHKYVRLQ